MKNKPDVGDKVFVTKEQNSVWTGEGVIEENYPNARHDTVIVRMTTGDRIGNSGGFSWEELEPVNSPMKILSIKRTKNRDTGLKVYGKIQGESGVVYAFAYFRRPNFRGWVCSCESFLLNKFAKKRNCKHLRFIRKEVGRYAATVAR